jgi:hypothetical protein
MIAYVLAAGGFLTLCGQFLYEVWGPRKQTQDQATAIYVFGGLMFLGGILLSLS